MKEFHPDHHYSIENDIVLLRPLKKDDFEHLITYSIHEPELWKYSLTPANSEKLLKQYIENALAERQEGKSYPFIVFDKRTEQYAGCTRFYDIQLFHKTVSIGYTWYGKQFQGTGLNKNCKIIMLDFAFKAMQMERVEFRADARNQKSIAAMKSIGCKEEGILRSNCLAPNGRRDSIVLSILKSEWDHKVRPQLLHKINPKS